MSSWPVIGCACRDSPETPQTTSFCCVVLRASSTKECEEIVCRIGEALCNSKSCDSSFASGTSLTCALLFLQLLVSNTQNGLYNTSPYGPFCATISCCLWLLTILYNLYIKINHNRTQDFLLVKTFNRKTCDNILINSIKCSCQDLYVGKITCKKQSRKIQGKSVLLLTAECRV